ncbi:FAD-containing monooxygenase EthA, partial [Cronobacter sakazakii]
TVDCLRATVRENDLEQHIRCHHRVVGAEWSSETARWLVTVEHAETGEQRLFSAGWLFSAGGYYDYAEGYTPHFEGRERFQGQI